MYRVEIIQAEKNKIIHVQKGENLATVLMQNGFSSEHPCGGKGICGKCKVSVDGEIQLSCRYEIKSDITVVLPDVNEVVSVSGSAETGKITDNVCLALDIGTTTMALALVSLDEKTIIKIITRLNPQRVFGADVMSRIDYCRKNGVKDLHETVVAAINSMIEEFFAEYGKTVRKLYVSGNTTMLHLFFGVDCSSMGVSPYTPDFLEGKKIDAATLSIKNVDEIISLPNISAFVGADIVAGLNYIGMPQENKYNILVDLGTNAEVVLYSADKAVCTAAAAGPCFEGANISCGMSAAEGAIYSYSYDGKAQTIGNAPAKGICATGLVDILSELVKNETIDETGFMECKEFRICENMFLSQDDIRQFQLAKSAVYSAVLTLMNSQKTSFRDIERAYISGGFAEKLNISNAISVGLLPLELQSKYITLNNSSLLGTVRFACEQNDLLRYTGNAEYVDLAANREFSGLFVENMMFSFYEY